MAEFIQRLRSPRNWCGSAKADGPIGSFANRSRRNAAAQAAKAYLEYVKPQHQIIKVGISISGITAFAWFTNAEDQTIDEIDYTVHYLSESGERIGGDTSGLSV